MGWLSSLLWLGVVLGYSFVLGVRPPNLLNARVCRGMAFGGVDEEASQLLGTRTHVVTMGGLLVEFSSGCLRLCFCVGSTATKPSQCTGTSRTAFCGVHEEASELSATRTRWGRVGF